MNRTITAALALCILGLPVGASGQTDALTYTDPAMSYTAPADFTPVPVPSNPPDTFEQPTVMAMFVRHPKQPDVTAISLTMENTTEDLASYESDVESKARNTGTGDSVFVKKQLATLANGMPAYFLNITISADASEIQTFEYVWVDRLRGVTLAASGRYGVIDERSAKKMLSTATATAYPRNQI